MAEPDKNATNYWCKYCKTFVRNSPLERRNHESAPRHQGSLQRFLKDLHKTNERESREKQRAKAEVARLNGESSGSSQASVPQKLSSSHSRNAPKGPARQATREERKQQMAQLAAMGVVVPEEFRRENAMAGEWERVPIQPSLNRSTKPLPVEKLESLQDGTSKHDSDDVSITDRKRKPDNELPEDPTSGRTKRKPNWGSDIRHIGDAEAEADLDALLAGSSTNIMRKSMSSKQEADSLEETQEPKEEFSKMKDGRIKVEDISDHESRCGLGHLPDPTHSDLPAVKSEDDSQDIASMFKKKKMTKKALK